MKKRKICVVTGSRSDYGLLREIINGIQNSKRLQLQLIVTGMHLSPKFGLTYKEIEKDKINIDEKVEMLLSSDTSSGITKSMGLGLIGFADKLERLKPDLMLILGDRFEIFSACAAAMIAKIPIAHIHGGESTVGAFDESIRHSISKMAHLHFVSTKRYKKRVIQLGENPKNIFHVGAPGIDNIINMNMLKKPELEKSLNMKLNKRNLLVTFHPVTLEDSSSKKQMKQLLAALSELKNTNIIFTMPNADNDSRILFKLIENFVSNYSFSKAFTSLGQLNYLSCIKHFDGVVGNSSSGLIEVPTFKKGTINIGDRQRGRIKANSVIDCNPDKESILTALELLYSKKFKDGLKNVVNPYGNGGVREKIVKILEKVPLNNILKKEFYNLKFNEEN